MKNIGFSSLWTALAGTAFAVAYMFANFASASDVAEVKDQIISVELRLIKSDIREIRKELRNALDDQRLLDELEEVIDDLCLLKSDDRECK